MSTSSASARDSVVDRTLWTASGYLVFGIVVALIALSAWLAYTGLDRFHAATPWIWLFGGAGILANPPLPAVCYPPPTQRESRLPAVRQLCRHRAPARILVGQSVQREEEAVASSGDAGIRTA